MLDEEVRFDPVAGSGNLLDKPIAEASRIDIPAGAGLFSLAFSVPEYTNPRRIVCS